MQNTAIHCRYFVTAVLQQLTLYSNFLLSLHFSNLNKMFFYDSRQPEDVILVILVSAAVTFNEHKQETERKQIGRKSKTNSIT